MLCNWDVINEKNKLIDAILCDRTIKDYLPREKSRMFHILYAHIHGCAMLVPKKCFETVGVFDVDLRVAHDYEFFRRILEKFPHKLIPEVLVIARDGSNRQGKRASTRCNVEYSLLLIDIVDHLEDEEIFEMDSSKHGFYLSLLNLYYAAGFTIAGEYVYAIAVSLGYVKEKARKISLPSHSIFARFFKAVKKYGLGGTLRKILKKISGKLGL
jgi:hypothetical protein